jgi:hypothetical protein
MNGGDLPWDTRRDPAGVEANQAGIDEANLEGIGVAFRQSVHFLYEIKSAQNSRMSGIMCAGQDERFGCSQVK